MPGALFALSELWNFARLSRKQRELLPQRTQRARKDGARYYGLIQSCLRNPVFFLRIPPKENSPRGSGFFQGGQRMSNRIGEDRWHE